MTTNLDIIIPVYNEGRNIIKALEALGAYVRTPFRVLICYDHDDDNTLEALGYFQHPSVRVDKVKNRGRGVRGAVLTGFAISTAPAVLTMPADDNYNASRIDDLVREFEAGADIVTASRFVRGGCMKGCPWPKAVLVRLSAWMLYHLARLPVHDSTNGFRLFSRRVIEHIPVESPAGWAFSIELLVKCHRLGWRIAEVPARWFERTEGKSRFRILRWLPVYLRWYFYAFATAFGSPWVKPVFLREASFKRFDES